MKVLDLHSLSLVSGGSEQQPPSRPGERDPLVGQCGPSNTDQGGGTRTAMGYVCGWVGTAVGVAAGITTVAAGVTAPVSGLVALGVGKGTDALCNLAVGLATGGIPVAGTPRTGR